MSEEEYMECSVVAYPRQIKFLHINGCAISYYVDRHVSDYVDRLQQENQKLKIQISAREEVCDRLESNWNKLKEYTQEKYDNPSWASCGARYVLEKMQELEQGKDER